MKWIPYGIEVREMYYSENSRNRINPIRLLLSYLGDLALNNYFLKEQLQDLLEMKVLVNSTFRSDHLLLMQFMVLKK